MKFLYLLIYFLLILLLILQIKADEIVFLLELWRHGARAPLQQKYSKGFSVETEMLSTSGRRQHYLIGRFLRKKYIDELKFLSPTYRENEIHVTSTHIARTIESARCHMLGLYPPKLNKIVNISSTEFLDLTKLFTINTGEYEPINQQNKEALIQYTPVPVFNKEFRTDTMFSTGACPFLFIQEIERMSNTSYWKEFDEYFRPRIIPKLSKIFDIPSDNITVVDAYYLSDVIIARQYEGLISKDNFTQDEWKDIERLQITVLINTYSTLGGKLVVSKLMNPAIEFMKLKMGLNYDARLVSSFIGTEKYIYFSTHDMLIAHVFKFLNPENLYIEYVEYASNFIFELYTTDQGEYYVKILYNNQQLKLTGWATMNCTFTELEAIFTENGFKQDEVFEICNSATFNTTKEEWF